MSRWKVDGRYTNLDPFELRGFRDVQRWRRERRARGWKPTGEAARVVEPDLARIRSPPGPQATWIGHASWLLQMDGRNVLLDPVWGHAGLSWVKGAGVARERRPGIPWDALPKIDLVAVSHNHYDHLDDATIRRLPRSTPIAAPSDLGGWFRRRGFRDVHEVAWWESDTVGGVALTSVPAQHWSRRGLLDVAKSHWCGWILEGERRVHFAGDSGAFSGFREIGARLAPQVAILPIGAYEPRWFMQPVHLDPDEAVLAYRDLKASSFLPMHWGTFRLTDEPLDAPPLRLAEAWKREAPTGRVDIPAIGETVAL